MREATFVPGRKPAALAASTLAVAAPIGIVSPFAGDGPTLARLDPVTLRAEGPRLRLGEYHGNWSFSPDGSRVALGMGGASPVCGRGICIVDVRSMRIVGYVHAPIAVQALAWPRERRIVAVLQRGGVLVADPVTETVRRQVPLQFLADGPPAVWTREGFAVLMRGRLVVVGVQGDTRVARLRRIPSNAAVHPAMAVDRRRLRAYVFAAGAPAAEVNLRTLSVRYHRIALPPPAARARTSSREAVWLGAGRVAVSGSDVVPGRESRPGPGGPRIRTVAAGVRVVDTRTWTARTVHPRAGRALAAGGRLIVHTPEFGRGTRGVGLRIYTREGRRLVTHLMGDRTLDAELHAGRVYAYPETGAARTLHIVGARTGRLIRRVPAPPRGKDVNLLAGRG
jgi:hypothetical protein